MKLQDLALIEPANLFTAFLSLFFVRMVKMVSSHNNAAFVVLGVPPWRELKVKDCYTKKVYQVYGN